MLQNRKFKIVLVFLTITIVISAQRQQKQGQFQGRRNAQQPQIRQLEQRRIQEREQKAREILKYMNSEIDPCNDFYNFACGNWLQEQNTDMVNEGDLVSVQSVMEQLVNKQLQATLKEPITSLDSVESKVVKNFYKSCLREPASSPAQRQFVQNFVLHHGGLPDLKGTPWQQNYNWIYVIAYLRRNYGLDILIGLKIDSDRKVVLEEPQTTLLPVEHCSALASSQIDENDQVFDKIQQEIKKNLKSWFEFNESNALRIAGAIIRFEFDLCKYMRLDQTSSTPSLYNEEEQQQTVYSNRREKMHGVKQNTVNTLQKLETLSENYHINFKNFVEQSLDTSTIPAVFLRSEEYFQQLSMIAKKGLQASFANYIMYRALSEINFPLNERHGERPYYCINKIMRYMPQALGKLYNDKFYQIEAKHDLQDMFSAIKQAFANYLDENVNWMSGNVKKTIKNKIKTIELTYPSYPQNTDKLPVLDDNDYYWYKLQRIMMYSANQTILQIKSSDDYANFIEAAAVSIQKIPSAYKLIVGYGLLQKPFYSPFYSKSLKYSSIGVTIAREIIKFFDYQGLQENNMNTWNSWDAATIDNFSLIIECFRTQMSNNLHNNPNDFRNGTKVREIIIETSALNIAFNAYLKWLENQNKTIADLHLETLQDINFTNTQLFFIHFAQTHCLARHKVELPPNFLPLYRRTLEQYNINGPLSNNVEFGRDFSCDLGSDMNLDDKCLLY